jgi:hypothetical protein
VTDIDATAPSNSKADNASEPDPGVARIESFCRQVGAITSVLTAEQRAAGVTDLGVLDVALRRLSESVAAGTACPPTLLKQVHKSLDRLELTVARLEVLPGRAERGREVDFLIQQARGQRNLVVAIGRFVEPGSEPGRFRTELAAVAQTEFLISMCALFEEGTKRLNHQVARHYDGEELRQQRFEAHLAAGTDRIDRRLDHAEIELRSLGIRASSLLSGLGQIAEQDIIAKLVQSHQNEEKAERTAFRTFRFIGMLVASLALVPLIALHLTAPATSVAGWLGTIAPSTLILALATYCLRQAGLHRAEALRMRDKRLGMDTAVRAMSQQLTDIERSALQAQLERDVATAEKYRNGPPTPESLSVLPIEKVLDTVSTMLRKDTGPAPAEPPRERGPE